MSRGFLVAEETLRRLRRLVDEARRVERDLSKLTYLGKNERPRVMSASRLLVLNTSNETIPAGGVMRITGKRTYADRFAIAVDKPNSTLQHEYLVNGAKPIPAGASGYAADMTKDVELLIASGTPAYGESWGPTADSFSATQHRPGGFALGEAITRGDASYVPVNWRPIWHAMGKPGADISAGSSGTVTIWGGVAGSEATASITVSAYSRLDIPADTFTAVTWLNDHWEATAMEC
jgi:hypothetical protein